MHELSIVYSIVSIAGSELEKAGGGAIEAITLDIGELSGIELTSLEFAWGIGVHGTCLEGAALHINHIAGQAVCADCQEVFHKSRRYDACPHCGSFLHGIQAGEELKIQSLTLADIHIST
jgi:hydrogenase nickel incorporation protein HypA/HybF